MHHLHTIALLGLAALAALAVVPVTAQDDLGGPLEDISQLEGIASAVSRSWSVDYDAILAALPEAATADDPFGGIEGTIFLIGLVMEFEGEAEAEGAFALYRDSVIDEFAGFENDEEEVSEGAIDDLGDNAHGFDIGGTAEDAEGFYRYLMVQEDVYFFVVITAATSAEATASADSLAAHLVEEGEPSGDEASFNADGTSTGGTWGFFPAGDHESLAGLVSSVDEMLYPVPDEDA